MKETIKQWLTTIYERNGIGWTLATVVLLCGLIVLAMYLDINLVEWLN